MRHALPLLLAASLSTAAHAGRPLQAEDAGTIALQSCEIEAASAEWRSAGAAQRQTYLQLGCGVAEGLELALQAYRPRELGFNGKLQLLSRPGQHGDAQLTLAWSLSHRHVASAWRRSGVGLLLVASAPLSRDWVVHANLGHARDELQRRRSTPWALAVEHNGLGDEGRWQPMAEVYGDDRGRPWGNAALRVALVPERVFVDASLGRQLGSARARLATAGFKLAF